MRRRSDCRGHLPGGGCGVLSSSGARSPHGPVWCVLVAIAAAVCLPTSPHLSGRLLLTGTAVLGWNQVVWWTRLEIDRVSVMFAALVAGAATVVAYGIWGPKEHEWSVLPRGRWVDAFPCFVFLAGLVSVDERLPADPAERGAHPPAASVGQRGPLLDVHDDPPAWCDSRRTPTTGGWRNLALLVLSGRLPRDGRVDRAADLAARNLGRDDLLATYWPASALVVLAGVTVLTAGLTSLPLCATDGTSRHRSWRSSQLRISSGSETCSCRPARELRLQLLTRGVCILRSVRGPAFARRLPCWPWPVLPSEWPTGGSCCSP